MQVPFQGLDHQRNIWTKCYLELCNFGGMVDSTINFGSPRVHLKHWCEQGSSLDLLQTKFQQAPTMADIDDLHKHVVCAKIITNVDVGWLVHTQHSSYTLHTNAHEHKSTTQLQNFANQWQLVHIAHKTIIVKSQMTFNLL
jgi:hypothetical protein